MSGSATVTYSAVSMGGVFNYEVLLHNTSLVPFDIYSFLFGWQYDVPITSTSRCKIYAQPARAARAGHPVDDASATRDRGQGRRRLYRRPHRSSRRAQSLADRLSQHPREVEGDLAQVVVAAGGAAVVGVQVDLEASVP